MRKLFTLSVMFRCSQLVSARPSARLRLPGGLGDAPLAPLSNTAVHRATLILSQQCLSPTSHQIVVRILNFSSQVLVTGTAGPELVIRNLASTTRLVLVRVGKALLIGRVTVGWVFSLQWRIHKIHQFQATSTPLGSGT